MCSSDLFPSHDIFQDIIWLRAYFGDVLVVILIYTFMLTFLEIKNKMLLNIGVFLFACAIEFAQYFHFADWFGLKDNTIAMIVLGNSPYIQIPSR